MQKYKRVTFRANDCGDSRLASNPGRRPILPCSNPTLLSNHSNLSMVSPLSKSYHPQLCHPSHYSPLCLLTKKKLMGVFVLSLFFFQRTLFISPLDTFKVPFIKSRTSWMKNSGLTAVFTLMVLILNLKSSLPLSFSDPSLTSGKISKPG